MVAPAQRAECELTPAPVQTENILEAAARIIASQNAALALQLLPYLVEDHRALQAFSTRQEGEVACERGRANAVLENVDAHARAAGALDSRAGPRLYMGRSR